MASNVTTLAPQTTTVAVDLMAICDAYRRGLDTIWLLFSLVLFVVFIFILSFFKQRNSLCLSRCDRRPGIVIPINFIEGHQRRFLFGCCFAVMSYRALELFDGRYFIDLPQHLKDDAWFMERFSWIRTFIQMANILLVAFSFYPLVACVSMRKNILANIFGFLDISYWIITSSLTMSVCSPIYNYTGTDEEHKVNIMDFLFVVPVMICHFILLIGFVYDFVRNVIKWRKKKAKAKYDMERKQNMLTYRYRLEIEYVKALLKRKSKPEPDTILEKLKSIFYYKRVAGFSYSPRIVCTMVVAFCCLYKLATRTGILGDIAMDMVNTIVDAYKPEIEVMFKQANLSTVDVDIVVEYIHVAHKLFLVCAYGSGFLQVFMMIHMIISYRKHITWLMKGKVDWHFKADISPMDEVAATFRYSGYQVAYILYSYIIVLIISFIIIYGFTALIALPLKYGKPMFVLNALKHLWPGLLVSLIINFAQRLIAKLFFCQGKGKYLALNNLGIYHVFTYLLYFFNVILGLFSCLKRLLFSLVFGAVLIGRLDRNLLMRGFERFDTGFRAYLGMLRVDVYHNHPVLKAFVGIMWDTYYREKDHHADKIGVQEMSSPAKVVNKRIRNKWWKAVTLSQNKGLVYERMAKNAFENVKRKQQGQATVMLADMIGATGAGLLLATAAGTANAVSNIDIQV